MATTKSIRTDYLNAAETLQPFYQYPVQEPDFEQIIADKSGESIDRLSLQEVIRDQYEGLEMSEASRRHLEHLGRPNTYTITTGHQLVLFGGPMFTTYKVLTAIKLAQQLNEKHPDHHIVPIFWIHTEDHDFEEINHYYASFEEKRTYGGEFLSQVGGHILDKEIRKVFPAHFGEELKESYRPGRSMTTAFREYINRLFGEYGVLMLDADDPRLKLRLQSVIEAEVRQNAAFQLVNQTSSNLMDAGYPTQIHAREINLFYLDPQGRNRIVSVNGHYEVVDREIKWSVEEFHQLVKNHPEQFSPNVSLRPLYQEMILPNLCYIGGWGELSYWLQLRGVFEHFGVNFPLLLPRMSATIVPRSIAADWNEKGLNLEDFRSDLPSVFRKYMPNVWEEGPFTSRSQQILDQVDELTQLIEAELSSTLARSGEALKVKTAHYLQNLKKKAYRVMRNKYRQPFDEIEALKRKVQPDGLVQERVLSLASFPAFAPEQLIRLAWNHCEPLNLEHVFLLLND